MVRCHERRPCTALYAVSIPKGARFLSYEGNGRGSLYISDTDALVAFCSRISQAKVIAVDTEFLRERTFFPQLCLIQVATDTEVAAIDPLAIEDLSALGAILKDQTVTKVFHACAQDLEVLYGAFGFAPTPLFDTQLAAAFLGHRLQIGYGALVEAYRGVRLPKANGLTDWARRPLDSEQLAYAEDDVTYLPGIYAEMVDELARRDRLSWVLPEMEQLVDIERYEHDPRQAYEHLKRSSSLTRRQLAIAREVCAWREETAARRNIPRKWVVSDEVLVELCKGQPRTSQALRRVRGTEQLSERDVEALIKAVAAGVACPADALPSVRHHVRPSAEMESVLDLMYSLLRIICEREGIATQLVASRDDLYAFARNRKDARLATGWRHELCGKELGLLLAGKVGLTVKDGRIEVL